MSTITISEIQLFNTIKKKLGEQEAEQLVAFVKNEVEEELTRKSTVLATKGDVNALKEDISGLKIDMARTESKLILWAFVFWATQLGAIFAFLKFLK